jgi:hypothetical protein
MSDIYDQEILARLLFEKFGKIALNSEEAASVIGADIKTLEADRAEALGIPYTRRNNKAKGQVMYAVTTIAKTLIKNQIKTI